MSIKRQKYGNNLYERKYIGKSLIIKLGISCLPFSLKEPKNSLWRNAHLSNRTKSSPHILQTGA